jgi:hypothetical protein
MMKLFLLYSLFILSARAIDKDLVLDPKTSTLIPKYMGIVKAVKGKVVIEDRELKKGSKVYAEDLIQTPDKGFAVIELIDLTTITLGPNSEFKADKWSYRTKNDRDAIFSVVKGQWRAFIRSKSKTEDQIKITTPSASMGVRGTELLVNVHSQGEKAVTQVALLEGAIHLEGNTPEIKKDLKPGDHFIMAQGPKGFEQKDLVLTADEKKSLNGFEAPDLPKLLERMDLNDGKVETLQNLSANKSLPEESEYKTVLKEEKQTDWRENLKKLNLSHPQKIKK